MEDPTVVLLAVGEDSGVLAEEIEKKGLHVVSCAFSEAEETIEENDPLLIVLHGARGAVELSTLLEDNPGGRAHKVAVVAPRKELAQLMGLNREIVVGLIALEMTEKTAAARVEALVRQNAKQRGIAINLAARRMSLGPRPSLAGRSSPPVSKEPMVLGAPTPGLGSGKALIDLVAETTASPQQAQGPVPEAPAPPGLGRQFARESAANERRQPSKVKAGSDESPGAARAAGETAIGLPQAPPKQPPSRQQRPQPAVREPDVPKGSPAAPPPLTPVPPGSDAAEASVSVGAHSLSPSILESIPVEASAPADVPFPARGASAKRGTEERAPDARPRNIKKTLVGVAAPPVGAPRPESPAGRPPAKAPAPAPIDWDAIDSIVPESLSPSEMDSIAPDDAPEQPQVPRAGALPEFDPSELLADLPLADLPRADLPLTNLREADEAASVAAGADESRSWLDEADGLPLVGVPAEHGADGLAELGEDLFRAERKGPDGEERLRTSGPRDEGPTTPRVDLGAFGGELPSGVGASGADQSALESDQDERGGSTSGSAWGAKEWGAERPDSLPFGATIAEPVTSPLRSASAELPSAGEEPPLPPEATVPPPAVGSAPEETLEEENSEEAWGEEPVLARPPAERSPDDPASEAPAKSSRAWLAAAALLIAGGGAAAYFIMVQPGQTSPAAGPVEIVLPERNTRAVPENSDEPDAVSGKAALGAVTGKAALGTEPDQAPAGADAAAASDDAVDSDNAAAADDAVDSDSATDADGDGKPTAATEPPVSGTSTSTVGGGSHGTGSAGDAAVTLIDNPFKTPDAGLAACEELAPDAKAETRDPVTEASTHWAVARKLIVKGDFKGASRAMCMAVAINPQSPANEGLARLYVLAYSPAAAMPWVEKALALTPDDRELINLRGDILSQLGRQEDATAEWLRALSLSPQDEKRRQNQAREYAAVARQHRARGDLPKAEQFYRRALGLEPLNLAALAGMADVLLARGLLDHAGTFAVRTIEVFEAMPEVHLVLGDVALAKKQPDAARASYQRALAIRPDFWPAKTRLRELAE